MAAGQAGAGHSAGDPFEALGDPNRRAILALLREGGQPVAAIAARLPISRPAVSRHLRLLKDAGLVTEQAAGTRRIYRLRDEGLQAVKDYLETVWGEAAARFRLLAENTTPAGNTSPAVPEPRQPGAPQRGQAAAAARGPDLDARDGL